MEPFYLAAPLSSFLTKVYQHFEKEQNNKLWMSTKTKEREINLNPKKF